MPFDIPKIEYKQLGRRAGAAYHYSWKIVLNSDFLKNGSLNRIIDVTLPHEIAHLLTWKIYNCSGHGGAWKRIMKSLGLAPKRCYSWQEMDLVGVKLRHRRKFKYVCPQCDKTFLFGIAKHQRHQQYQHLGRGYFGLCCRKTLVFSNEII